MWTKLQCPLLIIALLALPLCSTHHSDDSSATLSDDDYTAFKALILRANNILDYWCYPLPNARVISPYGGERRHQGVDLKTFAGDTIVAAFDGIVTRTGYWGAYGNMIEVQHTRALKTLSTHCSKILDQPLQEVKTGDPLGLEGATGRATTHHLHFEVFYNNRKINPAIMFDHNNHLLRDSIPFDIGD